MKLNVIGMPLFYGCDRPGVEKGPDELRKSNLIEILNKNHEAIDLGNINIDYVNSSEKYISNPKLKYLDQIVSANKRLSETVYNSLVDNAFPLIIGGDHSLSIGSISGSSKYLGDDLAVIWIDAHGDINTEETTPSGNIHGMPLATSMGIGYEKLTSLFSNGIKIKPENVFILACRVLDKGEIELIDKLKLNVWDINKIKTDGVGQSLKELLTLISEKQIKNIHLSYDIDCLDPEYVPGTGTPVEDGLTFEESRILLEGILGTSLVKTMDFVEYNPSLDKDERTRETCIELLKIISNTLNN